MKHMIWQDAIYENDSDWEDSYEESSQKENMTLSEYVTDCVDSYLDDERANLDIKIPNGIFVYGNLGLWSGRKWGYANDCPTNVNECLRSRCDGCMRFYVDDDGDFVADESHHDGKNYYTFREWRDGVTDEQKDALKREILAGRGFDEMLNEYTLPLGNKILKVYGLED